RTMERQVKDSNIVTKFRRQGFRRREIRVVLQFDDSPDSFRQIPPLEQFRSDDGLIDEAQDRPKFRMPFFYCSQHRSPNVLQEYLKQSDRRSTAIFTHADS